MFYAFMAFVCFGKLTISKHYEAVVKEETIESSDNKQSTRDTSTVFLWQRGDMSLNHKVSHHKFC